MMLTKHLCVPAKAGTSINLATLMGTGVPAFAGTRK